MSSAANVIHGALIAMSALAALFFARYWRLSRDRFFLWFVAAFVMFAVNWTLVVCDPAATEHASHIFAVRLVGFLMIVVAILDKNRR